MRDSDRIRIFATTLADNVVDSVEKGADDWEGHPLSGVFACSVIVGLSSAATRVAFDLAPDERTAVTTVLTGVVETLKARLTGEEEPEFPVN